MKLLGTGLSGLVGTTVVRHLSSEFEFENLSLETGVDITKPELVDAYVQKTDAEWILHFAAKTNVDEAETEKDLGKNGSVWIVNVGATQTLVNAAKKYHKKLLYISTDFVFPGGRTDFTEEDTPSPVGWYATTKYEGEKVVGSLGNQSLIVRISFPYGPATGPRPDFVGKIRSRFVEKQKIVSPTDQLFVPTYIDDIAEGIGLLIRKNANGMYHLVGSNALSSFDAAKAIATEFTYDASLVSATTASEFYKGRAPRAFQLGLSNAKIRKLGLLPKTFTEGLALLHAQEK
jgi:dTDP-4-dehydrorhamnose reductase